MNLKNIIAIIQARMGSSRLPGKVLQDIADRPMLVRVVERVKRAKTISQVVVASTSDASDDEIQKLCLKKGYICYRGSHYDVLDRYYQAACLYHADIIVRITGDCPLIDPGLIDLTVNAFLGKRIIINDHTRRKFQWDFVTNRLPPPWHRTYPIGLDTEVCSFEALERAWSNARLPYHREHVMTYLYEPERAHIYSSLGKIPPNLNPADNPFHVLVIDHEPDYGMYRWTVDTAEDLALIRQIYAHFPGRDDFTWREVIALFKKHPELISINQQVEHKTALDIDHRILDQVQS